MFKKRQLIKATKKIFKQLKKQLWTAIKKQLIWLIRTLFTNRKRPETANSGFILPTVAMVSIVVVLLTAAILFRSFERSKNASNVRVNEVVLNAATPGIDRARAKLNKLFQDPTLPRATPTDDALYSTFTTNIDKYTFGDETKLKLTQKTDELQTAWQYPVDTDNNGKFDSYTLYGIYFKNPPVSSGKYTRARSPLEARTPPMTAGSVNGDCGDTAGTSATLVGSTGWFNIGGKLKKSFFVYTATVPITTDPKKDNYEQYKGNKGFSAIEYEQDRVQLPLVNNAVIYEDDLALTPGPAFKLNGRIFTNSNFLTGGSDKNVTTDINLYQVSSVNSCFYDADNSKISVGGNLASGSFTGTVAKDTLVHLYKGKVTTPTLMPGIKSNPSVTENSTDISYNSLAYVQRINRLIDAQIAAKTTDPQEVIDGIKKTKAQLALASYTATEEEQIRRKQLELYFKKRTRRVPYTEVPVTGTLSDALNPYSSTSPLEDSGDALRPKDDWVYPTDPDDGKTGTAYTELTLNKSGDKLIPGATEPTQLEKDGVENSLGDRVLIGNNLPQLWWDKNKKQFVGPDQTDTQDIKDIKWNKGDGTRTRRSRVEQLADLGATDRDKDWELAAAKIPTSPQDSVGGLRVVTGAGIYLPPTYTTTGVTGDTDFAKATAATKDIWSDLMVFASDTATTATTTSKQYSYITLPNVTYTPYLRMRATAVYHYNVAKYDEKAPKPIACVSSYYDPTDKGTARNQKGLADVSPALDSPKDDKNNGLSNNGVVYPAPTKTVDDYKNVLNYQTQLKYPNGRLVNEPLKNALAKTADNRTLSEQSAIDAALCALEILDGSKVDNSVIPDGAIMETAFLDARQIKAIDTTTGSTKYDLGKEQRQPLEIRATVLDINLLRGQSITGGVSTATEYLIPNSGIIYATRDDALLDLSSSASGETQKLESSVDFNLDPTRRPNSIMLTNGPKIWRENKYRDAEKGLILASNLPVYVKGDFNLHTQQEFTEDLNDDWSNFYSRPKTGYKLNAQFACRQGDARLPKCTTGDEWRPASVLADAVTLLSNSFRFGYRNEGDYDLNNNLTNSNSSTNNYVTNFQWYDSTGYPIDFDPTTKDVREGSSYLNNFVTPIQRRTKFNEYLMEVCPKLPASVCQNGDFIVVTKTGKNNAWKYTNLIGTDISDIQSGTTAQLPASEFKNYPRRVAFKRDTDGSLVYGTAVGTIYPPIPLGIKNGKVDEFPYSSWTTKQPDVTTTETALWFSVTKSSTDLNKDTLNSVGQPLFSTPINKVATNKTKTNPALDPVLQIETPFGTPQTADVNPLGPVAAGKTTTNKHEYWLQKASETTFNLIAAAGDTPARPTEDNGGLHNFVRFLENWNPIGATDDAIKARISGAFIQFKRSAYATGPYMAFLTTGSTYKITGTGKTPFALAPTRQWGYDVGLLSQSPDLFAQKLVRTPDDLPDEFFREVGRDDVWVQTLLCGKTTATGNPYAIDKDQRPAICQS